MDQQALVSNPVGEKKSDVLAFLELASATAADLIKRAPAALDHTPVMPVIRSLQKISNLAWALRKYPIIDVSFFSMSRRDLISVSQPNGTAKEIMLWVPVFAAGHATMSGLMGSMGMGSTDTSATFDPQYGHVSFDFTRPAETQMQINRDEISRQGLYGSSITLKAMRPRIPAKVMAHVNDISGKFDQTALVWEASWKGEVRVDPFIIGQMFDTWFLIDQFDLSKMEHYVLSEFVKSK